MFTQKTLIDIVNSNSSNFMQMSKKASDDSARALQTQARALQLVVLASAEATKNAFTYNAQPALPQTQAPTSIVQAAPTSIVQAAAPAPFQLLLTADERPDVLTWLVDHRIVVKDDHDLAVALEKKLSDFGVVDGPDILDLTEEELAKVGFKPLAVRKLLLLKATLATAKPF